MYIVIFSCKICKMQFMFLLNSALVSLSANTQSLNEFEKATENDFPLTKWMYLELFTHLYMSQEQTALLPISLPVYLPLHLFALIWLQLQCPDRRGRGKMTAERWGRWAGQEGQRRRRGGGQWKERMEGHRCLKRMLLWTTSLSHSIQSVVRNWKRDRKRSINRITRRGLHL